MAICAVVGCCNRSKSSSRKESANTNLFRLRKVVEWQDERTKALSSKRRSLWLARIKRADLKGDLPNIRVCGAHFRAARRSFKRTTPEVDAVTAAPARAFGVGATPPENRYDKRSGEIRLENTVRPHKRTRSDAKAARRARCSGMARVPRCPMSARRTSRHPSMARTQRRGRTIADVTRRNEHRCARVL
ncbi:hypothetical protein HPB49_017295 [Dermacentor silvarum]|uniref:Uncharacterized protein n=1 Tax=Dermacentor silvarum TaxID=543639 RepID=A0ACB8E111_DERSI|nr:hypothetical protein HPB49_017295 [Dermacentor silvarum]